MHAAPTCPLPAYAQRWILRVILKDMHLWMKEDTIFNMLHKDAKELYNSTTDLRATCEKCIDPAYTLDEVLMCPFRPMKPKLAHREKDWRSIHKRMHKRGAYVAEDKLDGERQMLHFKRGAGEAGADRVKWFSRNQIDSTAWYMEAMAPVLQECMPPHLGMQECILDGEMMVWKQEEGCYAKFGENRSLSDRRARMELGLQPCYVVFDCVWVNGEAIDKLPLDQRRARIEPLVKWVEHSMQLSRVHLIEPNPNGKEKTATHTAEFMLCLDRALARGLEGILLKSLSSIYTPGSRGDDWIKLKPDYVDDMGDDLDLLIIAGYYGEGVKRGGGQGASHFLLGLKAPEYERQRFPKTNGQPLMYPFVKVGTGYTKGVLEELRAKLKPAEKTWYKHQRPAHLCGWVPNKTVDEPDFWYEPAKSVIMSVKAFELVVGEAFSPPCRYTLRFPRCTRFRWDKAWHECEEYAAIDQREREGRMKISMGKRAAADIAKADPSELQHGGGGGKRGKKESGGVPKREVGVLASMKLDPALKAVKAESETLKNVVAVVRGFGALDDSDERSKKSLHLLIRKLGGVVHLNLTDETTHIVSADEEPGAEVRKDIERAHRDAAECVIVRASWLLDCARAKQRLPLEPRFALYASEVARSEMSTVMDEWGDRYREDATLESLEQAMALVRQRPSHSSCEEHVCKLLKELPDTDAQKVLCGPACALLGVVAYAPRAAVRIRLRIAGATVVAEPAGATHAVLPASSISDGTCAKTRAALRQARLEIADASDDPGVTAWLVDEAWLDACEAHGMHIAEAAFALHEQSHEVSGL
jgi:DNA ligase-4